jgi:transcriptional regulator with XRE-family HTH domain
VKFSERLKTLMDDRPIKQSPLAEATGISQGALSNYLSGRVPKADELCKLADFFGVSTDDLLGRSGTSFATPQIARDIAVHGEASIWRDRAKAAEQELADLKDGLRALLNSKAKAGRGKILESRAAEVRAEKP